MKRISRYDQYGLDVAADRKLAKIYARWFRDWGWTHYCTFTFAWSVSDQQADRTFRAFIARMEEVLRVDVVWIRGDEKNPSGCGKPVSGRHFHVLLAFPILVGYRYVEEVWMSMAGKREDGAGALALPYDPTRNAAEYIMKRIATPDGNWDCYKLHLLLPDKEAVHLKSRHQRNRRRYKKRLDAALITRIDSREAA